jgi:hypothetical protein
MSKWLKIAFFTALLIGAGYFFGVVCKGIGNAYEFILSPSKELLGILLKFLLAVGVLMLTAGLVAALIRPLWIAYIAFAFSGIAILLGWRVSTLIGAIILIYILAGSIYAMGVAKDLKERIRFSMRSIGTGQNLLSMSLVLVACGSLYLGYKEHIDQVGFSVPESFLEIMADQVEEQIGIQTPEEGRSQTIDEIKEGVKRSMEGLIYQKLKPYEAYIPLGLAAGVFMSLVTIIGILMWLPNMSA